MKKINYSAINTAYRCQRLYKYTYIDKLPPDKEAQDSADLAFGTAVHAGLQAYLEGENGLPVFQALWNLEQERDLFYTRFKWPDLEEMGTVMLTRFERLHLKKFKNVTCEETLEAELDGITLYGTPDVVCDFDAKKTIIDFKTSGQPYDKDKIITSEQFGVYDYLLSRKGIAVEQYMYYVFVKQPEPRIQVITHCPTPSEKHAMFENIKYMAKQLTSQEHFPQNRTGCVFAGRKCQFWNRCYGQET